MPGKPERDTVAKIVQHVGEDRQAVRPQTADDLEQGERRVQEECGPDPLFGRCSMVMIMLVYPSFSLLWSNLEPQRQASALRGFTPDRGGILLSPASAGPDR